MIAVRLEDVQALELLVQHGERLKLARFLDLDLEPVFYLELAVVFEVAVRVVEVSVADRYSSALFVGRGYEEGEIDLLSWRSVT